MRVSGFRFEAGPISLAMLAISRDLPFESEFATALPVRMFLKKGIVSRVALVLLVSAIYGHEALWMSPIAASKPANPYFV